MRVLSFFKGLLDLAHTLMMNFHEHVYHKTDSKIVNRNAIESESTLTFLKYLTRRAPASMQTNVTMEEMKNGKITFFWGHDFGSWNTSWLATLARAESKEVFT